MRVSTIALIAILCAARLGAQAPSPPPRRYPPAPVEPSRAVHAQYDPESDKTVLRLDPIVLDSTLMVSALVALDGRIVRKEADGVVLTFWSTAPGRPLARGRNVSLTHDGTATDLGEAWLTPQPRAGFTEVAMTSVSLDTWLAFASASEVRLRIGARDFAISEEARHALCEFASRMSPTPPTK
jgi:hypothetical protein